MSTFEMPLSIDDYKKLFGKVKLANYDAKQKFDTGYNFCQELKEKGINYFTCITHPEVLSSLDSEMYYTQYSDLFGKDYSVCKHLFVHEKKGLKRHFLIIVDNEKDVDLKKLREELDLSKLEFCSEDELKQLLNTIPGNVSLFHTKFDQDNNVNLIIDRELLDRELLAFHPLYNGMSLFLTPECALQYLSSINKEAHFYTIPSKNNYSLLEKVL